MNCEELARKIADQIGITGERMMRVMTPTVSWIAGRDNWNTVYSMTRDNFIKEVSSYLRSHTDEPQPQTNGVRTVSEEPGGCLYCHKYECTCDPVELKYRDELWEQLPEISRRIREHGLPLHLTPREIHVLDQVAAMMRKPQ